jgi:hypothetical protein
MANIGDVSIQTTESIRHTAVYCSARHPAWVFLSSASTHQNAVTIDGTVTWAPNVDGFEVVQLYFLSIARPTTVTTSGKGMSVGQNNQTSFILNGCFPDGLTVQGRSNSGDNRDFVFVATSVPGPTITNVFTFDKCLVEWVAGRLKGMMFNDCRFRIIGTTAVPPKDPAVSTTVVDWSVTGTPKGVCTGSNFTTDPFIDPNDPNAPKQPAWILDPGASVEFAGCSLHSLTVKEGATADIRSSECLTLEGPGAVNRRSLTMGLFTRKGENLVKFPVPFPDIAYNVSMQLQTNLIIYPPPDGALYPRVSMHGKTPGGFTVYDPEGKNG